MCFFNALGNVEIMKILVQNGAKVNFFWHESPIHQAASEGEQIVP